MFLTKVNNAWKRVRSIIVKPAGTAAAVKTGYVKVADVWKVHFQALKAIRLQATCTGPAGSNSFRYELISNKEVNIATGDKLIYEMQAQGPSCGIGVDCNIYLNGSTIGSMRDFTNPNTGNVIQDQTGHGCHPGDASGYVVNTWYYRELNLNPLAGYTLRQFAAVIEADAQGTYNAYFRDIRVVDANGNLKLSIFEEFLEVTALTPFNGLTNNYSNVSKTVVDSPV